MAQSSTDMALNSTMSADPALDRNRSVLRYILDGYAETQPDAPFVQFWPGPLWSYGELRRRVRLRASALAQAGVRRGDHVLCLMGNSPDLLCTWFAINYLGAVYVPINTGARGQMLEHILADADAPILIAQAPLVERLAEVRPGKVTTVLVVEGEGGAIDGYDIAPLVDPQEEDPEALKLAQPIEPWDLHAIMYTSGTTGTPRGDEHLCPALYHGPGCLRCRGRRPLPDLRPDLPLWLDALRQCHAGAGPFDRDDARIQDRYLLAGGA